MKKKLLSIFLVIVMLMSIAPLEGMGIKAKAATSSQQNIVAWADYYYGITWTAQKTVYGWKGNYTYSKGNTYRLPYGQPVTKGKYIGYQVNIDDFIAATDDEDSIFYTTKSYYSGYSSNSVYYATDCSGFVSICWGLKTRHTTSTIPSCSTNLGNLSSSTVNKLQIGDCLNSTSDKHVVLVTDVVYSGDTVKKIEITEQTPPQLKRTTYTASELVSKYSSKGYSIYRYSGTVSAPPSQKPIITSVKGDNHTEITIKWQKLDNATKYKVERRKSGTDDYVVAKSSTTSTTFTDSSLETGQRYFYRVTAYNGSTKLGTSESVGVYTKFASPTVESVSDSKLKITWNSVSKAESYTIMRRKAGDDAYKEIKTVTDTSYTDSGLSDSTQYYYWIKANCNVDGTEIVAKSTSAGQYTFTKAPTIKNVNDISKSEIEITWNEVSGAKSYRITRRKSGESEYKTIKSGLTATSYNDTGLETGQRYYYIVYATNSAGESASSSSVGGYTKFNSPTVTTVNSSQLNLSWDSVSKAESYTIKRRLYNGEYENIKTVTGTSYTDSGLQSGTQYYYWIQANCNVDGTEIIAKSESKGQYTQLATPKAIAISSTSLKISWNTMKGSDTYKYVVQRKLPNESSYKTIATITNNSYTDNNLSTSTTYNYRIQVLNSDGKTCSITDKVDGKTVDCSHSYTSIVTTVATCNSEGVKTFTCTKCGGSYTEKIAKNSTNHTGVTQIKNAKASTCTAEGYTGDIYCSGCNTKIEAGKIIPAVGHVWTDATCTTKKTCSTCGANEGDALGHSYISDVTKAATCTENGTIIYTCSNCSDLYTEEISMTDHDYTASITFPTTTEQGYTTYTCMSCGDSYVSDFVAPIPDVDVHTHDYTFVVTEPTCTEQGFTTYTCSCGDSYIADYVDPITDVDAHTHDYAIVVTAPTCTEQGYTTYTCFCGDSYVDDYVDMVDHMIESGSGKAPTCTEPGYTESSVCVVCGEVLLTQKEIPATGHTPGEWEVVTEVQIGIEGKEQQKCTVCGEIVDEKVIPALSDYLVGDANGDGKITASDARIVLRISAKLDKIESYNLPVEALDVTGDGKLTASDARKILRISAKLES